MKIRLIFCWLLYFTVCSFCNVDFMSLGRHVWRCKARVNIANNSIANDSQDGNSTIVPIINLNNRKSSSVDNVKCCCGKQCKYLRGLKSHQRSCKVIEGLNSEMVSTNNKPEQITNEIMDDLPYNESPELKPGIKADIFFRSELHTGDIKDYNSMETVERMNNVIYNYFVETYGAVRNKNDDKGLHDKYRDFSKHQLKKELRNLQKDVYVIKYVSKLLRNVTNKKNSSIIYITDHDKEIKENFWGYTKSFLEKDDSKKRTFTKQTCTNFFKRVFNSTTSLFRFATPSWFTKFKAPIHA